MFTNDASGIYMARFSLEEQLLFGRARLGIKKINEELFSEEFTGTLGADIWDYTGAVVGQNNAVPSGDRGEQIRGNVRYELTDHLGNVRSVITDRKLPTQNGGGVDYAPDVVSAQDYYPFGMLMPGRQYVNVSFSNNDYRYAFNGKEQDPEWNGVGNSYDFGARIYDSRLGRFLSLDPKAKKYSSIAPYVFVNNMPLMAIDPNGKDIVIVIGGYGETLAPTQQNLVNELREFAESQEDLDVEGFGSPQNDKQTKESILAYIRENMDDPNEKIIIYGYSWGGDTALELADENEDLTISLLVTVDPSDGPLNGDQNSVSENVEKAVNYFQDDLELGSNSGGNELVAEDPEETILSNVDKSSSDVDHQNIDEATYDEALRVIKQELLGPVDVIPMNKNKG